MIEYVWMRSLWVEADSFADGVCVDAFPFELKQIRLLIECVEMR